MIDKSKLMELASTSYFVGSMDKQLEMIKKLGGDPGSLVDIRNDAKRRQQKMLEEMFADIGGEVKVYLDDERQTPDGWLRCHWPDEVIALLKRGDVSVLSLDHDLGDDNQGTGYDVLSWLEEAVYVDGFVPPKTILIHTSNPSARQRMLLAVKNIQTKAAENEYEFQRQQDDVGY